MTDKPKKVTPKLNPLIGEEKIKTVGDLIDALSQYPREHYLRILLREYYDGSDGQQYCAESAPPIHDILTSLECVQLLLEPNVICERLLKEHEKYVKKKERSE